MDLRRCWKAWPTWAAVLLLIAAAPALSQKVTGNSEGVTEVKATSELGSDGVLHTQSQYFKKGEWVPGHEVTYREDPKASVIFQ